MNTELIFIGIRLLFSLPILRFPLFGGVLAIFIDYIDLEILRVINGNLAEYQNLDKSMDMVYLALEAYVVTRFNNNLVKITAIILFFYRLIGFGLYNIFQAGWILVAFPNIFEWFYLYYLSFKKFFKKEPVNSKWSLFWTLVGLTIPKLVHEYLIHINTVHPWWKLLVR